MESGRLLRRIDELCDRFEGALKQGERPRLEVFLAQLEDAARPRLFRELLLLELSYLDSVLLEREEYQQRFPEYGEILDELLTRSDHDRSTNRESPTGHSLQVRCPECQHPIEVAEDLISSQITCSHCDNRFQLTPDADRSTKVFADRPRKIGTFQLLELIGQGGFGTVWKAKDTRLDRMVAIKLPRSSGLTSDQMQQTLREARAAARLKHPHIVSVHEVGVDNNKVYIVCDLVEGIDLSDWMTIHRVTPREAAEMVAELADALHHAHEANVIHRDLKPSNIMRDREGQLHITDFGLARRELADVTMTVDGQIMGTPAYMSPEQAKGEAHQADRRTDIYSLGVILFELLTGERPFRGTSRMLLHQVICDPAPSLRKLNQNVPRDLETVCLKCLEKQPDRRYPTARAVKEELQRFLNGEAVEARPVGTLGRLWRWYAHNPSGTRLVAGALLALLGGTLALYSLIGCVIVLAGAHPGLNTTRAVAESLGLISVVYLPILLAGIRTLNGHRDGLWIGLTASSAGIVLAILAACGMIDISLTQRSTQAERVQFIMPFAFFAALGAIGCLFGLASRNRSTAADSRNGIK